MVVKILKPILTRNKQFCALKLNLQAHFLKMKTILQKLIAHAIFFISKSNKVKKRAIMKDEIVGELHQLHSLKY